MYMGEGEPKVVGLVELKEGEEKEEEEEEEEMSTHCWRPVVVVSVVVAAASCSISGGSIEGMLSD